MKEFILFVRQKIEISFMKIESKDPMKERDKLTKHLMASGVFISMVQLNNYGYIICDSTVTYKPYFENDLCICYCYRVKAKEISVVTELAKRITIKTKDCSIEIRPIFSTTQFHNNAI